jgi:hypothetical protein
MSFFEETGLKKIIITVIFILFTISQLTGCNENIQNDIEQDTDNNQVECTIQKPGSDDYNSICMFNNPLEISENNPGPGNTTSLESCIEYCLQNLLSCECRDWIQSIYTSFNTSNQVETEKINGIWLPTICTIRDAVKKIPTLKEIGINTVSFGPDIDTRHFDEPTIIGANLFRFYIKLFEDAGFNVHLVPNPMHWGNNDVSLYDLNGILYTWAEEAEKLNAKFYVTFNEVDGMQQTISETSAWLQEILPGVRERYNGIICVQPTQPGFESEIINYSVFDCVSSFYPLMTPDENRNTHSIEVFTTVANNVRDNYPSIKYIMFNDVHTFSGGNWAETGLMEEQNKGGNIYSTEQQQKDILERYLEEVHPYVNGSFFNNYRGFTFIGRLAEQVIKQTYIQNGTIEVSEKDYIWNTTGFLELIEKTTLDENESKYIFDLDTYSGEAAGWAGLCFEPSSENPGPFNCTSVEECMAFFKENPEEYWALREDFC